MSIPKPSSCQGCPFYAEGDYWVPDEIHEGARVAVVAQNPGQQEEVQGRPLIGQSGDVWEKKYLKRAGLNRDEVSIHNVIRCRVGGSNELPPLTQSRTREAIAHCQREHYRPPAGHQATVSLGAYSLYGLTGESHIDRWRGYVLDGHHKRHLTSVWHPTLGSDVPVLATVHPAALFRDPTLSLATLADWAKLGRLLAGVWPRKPPQYLTGGLEHWPDKFAFDTEFDIKTNRLFHWSAAWRGDDGPVVYSVPYPSGARVGWHRPDPPTVISQYASADMHHLDSVGDRPWGEYLVEDSIWKHAVLYSDHPHDLNYLGSIWSSMNRWKHLSSHDPSLYAACDAWGLWEINEALDKELSRDPYSKTVWETIDRPALPHFIRAQYRGLQVDQGRLGQVIQQLGDETRAAAARARAIAGWPINVGSASQVSYRLFQAEKLGAR